MRKLFGFFLAALALSACASLPGAVTDPASAGALGAVVDATGTQAPAPLASTVIDDHALIVALQGADTIATAVDALVAAHVLVPGTPRALAVKSGLQRLKSFLEAASAAQRAGSTTSYQSALSNASQALSDIAAAVHGG